MSESDTTEKTGNPFIIFAVGISAGYIASLLPRLITYLSVSEESIELSFFSSEYFLASSIFALVIGVSMVWLNFGKKETTRNLFMSALALPSVISGSINMSSTTVSGEASLKELESNYHIIERALQDVTGVSNIPVLDIAIDTLEKVSVNNSFSIPFIKNAYAAEDSSESSNSFSMGVKFKSSVAEKNFVVIVEKSIDEELIKSRLKSYTEALRIPNLILKKDKIYYYIIQNYPRTKSLALIEVVKMNNLYGLSAMVARIK